MQNHNKILIQTTPNSRTYEWKIIILVRSVQRFSIKHMKKNIIHLFRIFSTLSKSNINLYYYWVHKQLTNHTSGMKFHTIWYD